MAKKWAVAAVIAVAIIVIIVGINAVAPSSKEPLSVAALSLTIVAGVAILLGILALVGIGYSIAGIANANEAFALPPGSVRALLALLITVGFIVMAYPQVLDKPVAGVQKPDASSSPKPDASSPKPDTSSPKPDTGASQPPTAPHTLLSLLDTSAYAEPAPVTPSDANKTTNSTEPKSGNSVLQILGTLMTTIVGFYFGSKSATDTAGKAVNEAVKAALGK